MLIKDKPKSDSPESESKDFKQELFKITEAVQSKEIASKTGGEDCEQLKRDNDLLKQDIALYKSFIENLNATVVAMTPDGIITYASPNWKLLLGHDTDEVLNISVFDKFIHPEDAPKNLEYMKKTISSGKSQGEIEYRIKHKDGSWKWHAARASLIFDEHGKVKSFLAIGMDISERKAANEKLRQSEADFRLLIENMQEGVIYVDNDDIIQYINRSCCEIYGFTCAEVIGKTGYEILIIEEDRKIITEKNNLRQQGISDIYEVRGRKVNGDPLWLRIKGAPIRNEAGEVIGSVGIMTDITKQKRIEEDKLNLLNIIDNSLNEIFIFDAETLLFDYVNSGALKNTGYTMDELKALTPLDVIPVLNHDEFVKMLQTLETGENEVLRFDSIHKRKDGSTYPVEVLMQFYKKGNVSRFFAVINDSSLSNSLREQLLASQKMDAIGRLAGGVAHDFNNLLTVILGYGEELINELPPDSPLISGAEEIIKAGKRASNLTRQLLTFSHKQMVQPRLINLNELVRNLHSMLQRIIGEDIEIALQFDHNLSPLKADAGQMEQIIVNLALNARDAMPSGGKLTIETANLIVGKELLHAGFDSKPGQYVLLSVTDTGCGMDKETKARIFEPFFTTKATGKGLGLGLSTVYGIVKQAEGTITVHSEIGKGTCFKLLFPISNSMEAFDQPRLIANDLMGKGEHILIVEDEVALLNFLSKLVRNIGYNVNAKSSSLEALALIKQGFKPNLIITDVVMPTLNGKEMADQIRQLIPNQQILFMSGYTDDTIVHHGVLEEGVSFIHKPFTAKDIATKISHLLAQDALKNSYAEILMLDDEESLRTLMQRVCTRRGHRLTGAGTLEEAMQALAKQQFDVMLIDMHLFCMDGVQALEQIRAAGITTPAIVFSGSVSQQEKEALKPLGVLKIMEKNFNNLPLLQLIEGLKSGVVKAEDIV
ncbi:MAG: PAS domain S-box protein [Candidatus Cloacimonetes bacterium]|nr:PAS domain S-box protein [Candidatus Cloacimonadota bacterium]